MMYDILNKTNEEGYHLKKDLMQNFSFSIYRRTYERYLKFKSDKKLTHDETINQLIDMYEKGEKENDSE